MTIIIFPVLGTLHIVGEVINESFKSMTFVKIIATFYDSNNNVVGTDFTYTSPSTLQPGQKAPFDMIVIEGSMPLHLVAYYTLSVHLLVPLQNKGQKFQVSGLLTLEFHNVVWRLSLTDRPLHYNLVDCKTCKLVLKADKYMMELFKDAAEGRSPSQSLV